jgi:hypothetical protein
LGTKGNQPHPYQQFNLANDIPLANRLHFVRRILGWVSLKQIQGEEPIDPELQADLDRVTSMDKIRQMLDIVDGRTRSLLIARFGFDGQPPHTLKACMDPFNLSQERIRQIEAKGLAWIRTEGRPLFQQ